jgi:hypothetical protein
MSKDFKKERTMSRQFGSDTYLMPPVSLYYAAGDESDEMRLHRYQTYLDFYNGMQWAERRRPGERRLTVNYSRTLVHKGASYLLGKPVRFELIPNGATDADAQIARDAEAALNRVWENNNLAALDYDAAVEASILGDCAFRVLVEKMPLEAAPVDMRLPYLTRYVKVRAADVFGLTVGWGVDKTPLWVHERYALSSEDANARFSRSFDGREVEITEKWTAETVEYEAGGETIESKPNPYGFIPYVFVPNLTRPRQFWGQSDLEDVMSLNSEFNVRVSILSQLLQVSGNPVLVLENVDSAEGMRVGPGAVWTLPEGAKAHLLELLKDGGVNLHIEYINLLYKMLHDLSEMPGTGFGRDEAVSGSSGVALDILLHPVAQRVNRKRRIWETAFDTRNRQILRLLGLPVHRSRIIWPDVLPRDRASLVAQEAALVASNIHSLETARVNLGDNDPHRENERIAAEIAALTPTDEARNRVKVSGALIQGITAG